jgi:hypothetical protein
MAAGGVEAESRAAVSEAPRTYPALEIRREVLAAELRLGLRCKAAAAVEAELRRVTHEILRRALLQTG